MHIHVPETSINAYHQLRGSGRARRQCARILEHLREQGGDWSIGELARALNIEKNAVSGRVAEMLHETGELVACPRRRDRVSGILVRPVALAPGPASPVTPAEGV